MENGLQVVGTFSKSMHTTNFGSVFEDGLCLLLNKFRMRNPTSAQTLMMSQMIMLRKNNNNNKILQEQRTLIAA